MLYAVANSIGQIEPPPGVDLHTAQAQAAGGASSNALLYFFSYAIKVATVVAGIWVVFNFLLAAYTYVTGRGEAKAHETVREKVTMSVIGLLLIIAAYTITAVLSLLLFGDASFVLNPDI